jgi:hypothetical protein
MERILPSGLLNYVRALIDPAGATWATFSLLNYMSKNLIT